MMNKTKSLKSVLSGGMINVIKYAGLRVYFAILRRVKLAPSVPFFVCLEFRYRDRKFNFYVKHQLDFDLLLDTFVTEEYLLDVVSEPKIIFDLGSNIGATVVFFKMLYPGVVIYAFEPDPRNLLSLRKNVEQFGDSVVIIEKAVVAEDVSTITFYQAKKNHWSSSTVERTVATNEITVPAITLEKAMQEYEIQDIDVCKFDIEGAEYGVFKKFSDKKRIQVLIGELHYSLMNQTKEDFLALFPDFKYLETRDGEVVVLQNNEVCE